MNNPGWERFREKLCHKLLILRKQNRSNPQLLMREVVAFFRKCSNVVRILLIVGRMYKN